MIVKVQVSITTPVKVLVYSKDRSIFQEFPLNANVKHLMRGRLKVYFNSRIYKDSHLELCEEVPPQPW